MSYRACSCDVAYFAFNESVASNCYIRFSEGRTIIGLASALGCESYCSRINNKLSIRFVNSKLVCHICSVCCSYYSSSGDFRFICAGICSGRTCCKPFYCISIVFYSEFCCFKSTHRLLITIISNRFAVSNYSNLIFGFTISYY